jgi:CheY-like chemotaxis protein
MTQEISFSVATLGFEERERGALRDLLRISEHRSPTFNTHVRTSGQLPHIVIVNADRPEAIERWRAFRSANEGSTRFSGVMLGTQPLARPKEYPLARPLLLPQLFTLLERIVAEVQGYQRPTMPSNEPSLFVLSAEELPPVPAGATGSIAPPSSVQSPQPAPLPVVKTAAPAETAAAEIAVIMEEPANEADAPAVNPIPQAAEPAAAVAPGTPSGPARATNPGVPAAEASSAAAAATPTAAPPPVPNSTAPLGKALADSSAIQAPASKLRVASGSDRSAAAGAGKTRILVVDDSLPVRIQMKTALESFTKSIDFADNGDQAVMLIDNCKYDVIFLDVIMPGRDGYDVCRYIRRHPLQKKTPVIMLTGNSSPADRVKGKLAGCDTYLIKPVRQSVLAEVIGEFIKSSAAA